MSHLLAISLGPVQEFIAAARRTADLKAGSSLLIQLARAAVEALRDYQSEMIFPAPGATDGPNHILAKISGDPAQAAAAAHEAAQECLRARWNSAANRLRKAGLDVDAGLAETQIDGFLEFYAGWHPLGDDYGTARHEADRLLAGRKALRNFAPSPCCPGRPKSPLDPSRDTVLPFEKNLGLPVSLVDHPPLFLKPRETLDAISILKRAIPAEDVPSTSLMALRTLLPLLDLQAPEEMATLRAIADASEGRFDLGDLFFDERLEEEEEGLDAPQRQWIRDLCAKALERVRPHALSPYYTLLVADGDRMGRLISAKETIEDHQRLSGKLSEFTAGAHRIVEGHNGYLIYSGGDDVLALLPANTAIACAAALAASFRECLAELATADPQPSLSAGIALVHHMEPLQLSLQRAREAERAAKNRDRRRRNSLAVAYHPRGGAPITVARSWEKAEADWHGGVAAFRAGLSRGFPYELRMLARDLEQTSLMPVRIQAEAERIAHRKRGGSEERGGGQDWQAPDWVQTAADLRLLADMLAICRFLAALPKPPKEAAHA